MHSMQIDYGERPFIASAPSPPQFVSLLVSPLPQAAPPSLQPPQSSPRAWLSCLPTRPPPPLSPPAPSPAPLPPSPAMRVSRNQHSNPPPLVPRPPSTSPLLPPSPPPSTPSVFLRLRMTTSTVTADQLAAMILPIAVKLSIDVSSVTASASPLTDETDNVAFEVPYASKEAADAAAASLATELGSADGATAFFASASVSVESTPTISTSSGSNRSLVPSGVGIGIAIGASICVFFMLTTGCIYYSKSRVEVRRQPHSQSSQSSRDRTALDVYFNGRSCR